MLNMTTGISTSITSLVVPKKKGGKGSRVSKEVSSSDAADSKTGEENKEKFKPWTILGE